MGIIPGCRLQKFKGEKTVRLALVALAIALVFVAASTAMATVGKPDGLINGKNGGTGYFNENHMPNGVCDNFVEVSGAYEFNGGNVAIFDYDDNTWVNCGENFVAENQPLEVICDIEMYVREHIDGTKIYFHIGDGEYVDTMSATVGGWFSSNNGQYIGLSKTVEPWGALDGPTYYDPTYTNKAAELKFQTDGLGRTAAKTPIPLVIEFSDDGGANWRKIVNSPTSQDTWSGGTGGLWGYYWLVANGDPCYHPFAFRFTIDPIYHQPDGRYHLDPVVVVAPAL
jgi:hypothetical protein